jgi:hypothetical protein
VLKNIILLIIALCAVAGAASATPSTLIWIPSTDIQAVGQTHFGYDIYSPSSGDTLTDIGLTIGNGKIEGGVDYLSLNGIEDPLRLNVKGVVMDETKTSPKIVLGLFDAGGTSASNMVYALGSKTFSGTRVHVGYCIGKESALDGDNSMILLGVDKAFNSKWWGAVDYQGGKSAFGALSAGVAYNFTPTTSLIVGYDWYNDSSLSDTMTVQLDVNF